MRSHDSTERHSAAWHRPLEEGMVVGKTTFDDRVYDTRHLGANGCKRLVFFAAAVLAGRALL
jgi:hypothetical protein